MTESSFVLRPSSFSFTRYLAAKKSVDDRALNGRVWRTLKAALPERPLRVLELGAGIGAMVERVVDWDLLGTADYTAVDNEPENIAALRQRLLQYGFSPQDDQLRLQNRAYDLTIHPQTADIRQIAADPAQTGQWDILIAHAVLDLLPLDRLLAPLLSLLKPGGIFYFTINFDGETIFEPMLDPLLDAEIMRLYHASMDNRLIDGELSGDSRAGRHLFRQLTAVGGRILAAGSSDWVVYGQDGRYPADEAYFLHCILQMMAQTLAQSPELDPTRFARWLAERQNQIDQGELIYMAHQLDFLGVTTDPHQSPNTPSNTSRSRMSSPTLNAAA
jgi:SAM-dependent methyltransferase